MQSENTPTPTDLRSDSLHLDTSMDMTGIKDVEIITKNGKTDIYFPIGSDKEIQSKKLEEFLKDISSKSDNRTIILTGHSDRTGDETSNIRLSLRRCVAIKNILVRMGVPEKTIRCDGKGSSMPKSDNASPENRALNRRVELKMN